uniref:Putative secreted protein n=1 Tax=Ixodes ricinus TaxID=34613 RepID=A0A6B0TU21_IXORI
MITGCALSWLFSPILCTLSTELTTTPSFSPIGSSIICFLSIAAYLRSGSGKPEIVRLRCLLLSSKLSRRF